MKVFISWSGEKSRRIALILKEWLPAVLQTLEPCVSSEDIGKGTRWSKELQMELEASQFGILCLTRENMDAPWLMFEAGVLSKMGINRISPFLYDMSPPEIAGPMQLFQATVFDKRDIWNLVAELNQLNAPDNLPEKRLGQVYERWYPHLERKLDALKNVQFDGPGGGETRVAADIAAIRRLLEEKEREQARQREEYTESHSRLMDVSAALLQSVQELNRKTCPESAGKPAGVI